MSAGVFQVMVGSALLTLIVTDLVAELYNRFGDCIFSFIDFGDKKRKKKKKKGERKAIEDYKR